MKLFLNDEIELYINGIKAWVEDRYLLYNNMVHLGVKPKRITARIEAGHEIIAVEVEG